MLPSVECDEAAFPRRTVPHRISNDQLPSVDLLGRRKLSD
jgi:hypothetical protein